MKKLSIFLLVFGLTSCAKPEYLRSDYNRATNFPKTREVVKEKLDKSKTWVFIMAGQSNMAGRGYVLPKDTLATERILSLNSAGELIYAKEPFHWYEPNNTGLDCGLSFAQEILKEAPKEVKILMIPVAIGGSSISQWLGDSTFRNVALYSNFKKQAAIAQQYGDVKGLIWHQGESDARPARNALYQKRLGTLFCNFRFDLGNDSLPIIAAELGSFSKNNDNKQLVNKAIHAYAISDSHTAVINTQDLKHRGDELHFNAKGQRKMGKRFAKKYFEMVGI